MKQRIRLTESELNRVVRNSMRHVLRENSMEEGPLDFLWGMGGKVKQDAASWIGNKAQKVKGYYNQAVEAGQKASNKAEQRKAIEIITNTLNNLNNKGLLTDYVKNRIKNLIGVETRQQPQTSNPNNGNNLTNTTQTQIPNSTNTQQNQGNTQTTAQPKN